MAKTSNKQNFNFESALHELQAIVERFEGGSKALSLENALTEFEKGVQLTKKCQQALEEAEQKVKILVGTTSKSTLESFSTSEEPEE